MNEKHLTYFKVENFKRFESFEMNDIGQFNLILGDNNVGKTSVLEALLFDFEDANQFRDNLLTVLYEFRKVEKDTDNVLQLFIRKSRTKVYYRITIKPDTSFIDIDISPTGYESPFDKPANINIHGLDTIFIGVLQGYEAETAKKNIPYIPFHLGYDEDLVTYYGDFIQPYGTLEEELQKSLKSIIPTINAIKISINKNKTPLIIIGQEDRDERIPLSMFGEGTIKLFRILMKIVVHRGKRLMIDEIDAGVHFKKFKDFWRTILLAAKQNEVQIFATTHNLECLQAFKEVLEETEMIDFQKDARCFELIEMPDKQVKAYTYNFEKFEVMIETGTNIRGGNY